MVTPGNVDDREPLRNKSFIERIFGRLVGDKGYICKELFSRLFIDGIQLITKLKSNMKGQIMTIGDRILLRKRALIETINDELKNMAQIEALQTPVRRWLYGQPDGRPGSLLVLPEKADD